MDRIFTWIDLYHFNFTVVKEDEYKILVENNTGEYREKGSKFLAYAYVMNELEELEEYLAPLRKQHPKACHFCYAYRLSPKSDLHRANDDGEPRGTAGLPIYNQILAQECYNILVVVVRYFGGTKLGASGLIRAYKTAAEEAVNNASFKYIYDTVSCRLQYDYSLSGALMDVVKSQGIDISHHEYGMEPIMTLELRESNHLEQIRKIKSVMLGRPLEDIEDDTEVPRLKFHEIESDS